MVKKFKEFLLEKYSGEVIAPKKGEWVKITKDHYKGLEPEIFDMIQIAYSEIGGHAKIQKPEDVFSDPDWNYWEGIDIHDSPDFDIIMFGQKTKYGVKFSGVGHDGSRDSKKIYLDQRGKDLKNLGFYLEASGKLAEILMTKYGVPFVSDREIVEEVLGKKVNWLGKSEENPIGLGWYERTIGGHPHQKILLGKPRT